MISRPQQGRVLITKCKTSKIFFVNCKSSYERQHKKFFSQSPFWHLVVLCKWGFKRLHSWPFWTIRNLARQCSWRNLQQQKIKNCSSAFPASNLAHVSPLSMPQIKITKKKRFILNKYDLPFLIFLSFVYCIIKPIDYYLSNLVYIPLCFP